MPSFIRRCSDLGIIAKVIEDEIVGSGETSRDASADPATGTCDDRDWA